jgi:hypothetical protein
MANVIKDPVRIPNAAGTLSTGVTLLGGGAAPVTTVHTRQCPVIRHKIQLNNLQMGITSSAGGAADAVGQKILTIPEGRWLVLAAEGDFTVTTPTGCSVATAVWSVGTAAPGDADATLSSTEADVVASQTLGDGTLAAAAAETEDNQILGTGSAPALVGDNDGVDLYFNIAGTFTHATVAAQNIAIDGTLELVLIDLGIGK